MNKIRSKCTILLFGCGNEMQDFNEALGSLLFGLFEQRFQKPYSNDGGQFLLFDLRALGSRYPVGSLNKNHSESTSFAKDL